MGRGRLQTTWLLGLVAGASMCLGLPRAAAHEGHEHDHEAVETHEHGPRHGGYFGDAEDLYHYELVSQPDGRIRLYVNDEHNEPLDVRRLSGRWTLHPGSSHQISGTFAPSTDGAYFEASLPISEASVTALEVAVMKDGQWVAMEFSLPATTSQEE